MCAILLQLLGTKRLDVICVLRVTRVGRPPILCHSVFGVRITLEHPCVRMFQRPQYGIVRLLSITSTQSRLPAELKHITKRRKRN